jgi:NAD(P)H-flavin reductase
MARFEFIPVLSAEPENSNWDGRRGFVPEHFEKVLGKRLSEHHAYLCGPPPMIDACLKTFEGAGIDPANVHFDKFLDRSHLIET